jgi:hypothetical protein
MMVNDTNIIFCSLTIEYYVTMLMRSFIQVHSEVNHDGWGLGFWTLLINYFADDWCRLLVLGFGLQGSVSLAGIGVACWDCCCLLVLGFGLQGSVSLAGIGVACWFWVWVAGIGVACWFWGLGLGCVVLYLGLASRPPTYNCTAAATRLVPLAGLVSLVCRLAGWLGLVSLAGFGVAGVLGL